MVRWVLVTDGTAGQGRSALAATRALAAAGFRAAVTTSGRHSIAAASRHCHRRIEVPGVDDPRYAEAVRSELATRPYLTVLPASDRALLALGITDDTLLAKDSLAKAGAAVGLATPDGTTFGTRAELDEAAPDLPYPAVVKPTISRFTAIRVDRPDDVARLDVPDGPFLVQPFIDAPLSSIAGVIWEGRLVAAVHQRYLRTWPAWCGGACAAETVDPDLAVEERVVAMLGDHAGIFHVQFAGGLLLDVNPRVYGSHPLAERAGVNLVGIACDLVGGEPPPRGVVRGRPGVFYRSLEGDIRNRIHAVRHGRIGVTDAITSLLPRRRAAHGPESLSDPGPMVARARYAADRLIGRTA
jgi:predicted ATP-grasp superfamily ATP-dependent carboligase